MVETSVVDLFLFFYLTFTGRQKVPKSDFQSHFPMSKNVRIFLKKNFITECNF